MSQKARLWKMKAKQAIPGNRLDAGKRYHLDIEFHHQWFYKNGGMKRLDLQNCLKVLIDALCEKWAIDDSLIWVLKIRKVDNVDSKIGITLSEV